MTRATLGSLAVLLASATFAQGMGDTPPSAVDTTAPHGPLHQLSIRATGLYDSNTLRNELVTGLYGGDFLDRALRERGQDALKGNNRGGFELSGEIAYTWGKGLFGKTWEPRIGVAYRALLGARFPDAVYDVTFFGNQAYEDRTAELGPSAFEFITYQTVGFGLTFPGGSFVQLNVVNGQGLTAGDIDRADLYTAVDGRYLEADLDGEYWRSDTASSTGLSSNGIGASVSGAWEALQWGPQEAPNRLAVLVEDAGFISWNEGSLRVPKNGVVRYEGIRVDDILDLDGLVLAPADLQDTLGLGYQRGGFIRPLPAKATARVRLGETNNTWTYEFSADMRYIAGYMPHVTATRRFNWGRVAPEIGAGYGGFGGIRAHLGVYGAIGRYLTVHVHTPNAVGLVSPATEGKALMAGADLRW